MNPDIPVTRTRIDLDTTICAPMSVRSHLLPLSGESGTGSWPFSRKGLSIQFPALASNILLIRSITLHLHRTRAAEQ